MIATGRTNGQKACTVVRLPTIIVTGAAIRADRPWMTRRDLRCRSVSRVTVRGVTEPVGERPYMPDYGVESEGWRALPWSWAAQRLDGARNYWVVTVSGQGRPHAQPVWGVWNDGEHRFCFSCGPRSRKARNLAANPRVTIASEDTVEALSLEGVAAPVTDDDRREVWIDRYVDKYRSLAPELSKDFLRANLVVEVTPDRAFAVIEREDEFSQRATRWQCA